MVRYHTDYSAGEIEDLERWCVGQADVESIEEGEESGKGDVTGGEGGAVGAGEGVVAAWSGLGDYNRSMVGLV